MRMKWMNEDAEKAWKSCASVRIGRLASTIRDSSHVDEDGTSVLVTVEVETVDSEMRTRFLNREQEGHVVDSGSGKWVEERSSETRMECRVRMGRVGPIATRTGRTRTGLNLKRRARAKASARGKSD